MAMVVIVMGMVVMEEDMDTGIMKVAVSGVAMAGVDSRFAYLYGLDNQWFMESLII